MQMAWCGAVHVRWIQWQIHSAGERKPPARTPNVVALNQYHESMRWPLIAAPRIQRPIVPQFLSKYLVSISFLGLDDVGDS